MIVVNKKNELPTSNHFIFIDKDARDYIHVDLDYSLGRTDVIVSKSEDGINLHYPVIGNSIVDSLPKPTGDLIKDSLAVINHFKSNGFKEVNKFTQTDKGTKFS
jgi:hypothetical protein